MTAPFKLEGMKELERELQRLTRAAGKGVLRRSLKAGALPVARQANANAPRGETGSLEQSFVYSTKLNNRQARQHRKMFRDDRAAVEGFVGTNDPAGIQQEFGNERHGPQPALRPAWDQEAQATLDRIGRSLWIEFQKSLGRQERKNARR